MKWILSLKDQFMLAESDEKFSKMDKCEKAYVIVWS